MEVQLFSGKLNVRVQVTQSLSTQSQTKLAQVCGGESLCGVNSSLGASQVEASESESSVRPVWPWYFNNSPFSWLTRKQNRLPLFIPIFIRLSSQATMLEALDVLNRSFKAFLDQGDPRVKDWPMMQSPFPGLAMIVAYMYFVKVAGPQFMKRRKAFELRTPMALYNFILVLINLYVFIGIGRYGYFNGYSLKCQPVDYSNNYDAVRMAQMGYFFYLTKFIEFADTIFFVLRKKDNQISALHVIHHSIVPFSLWFGIKFAPGGYNALFPFLNSLVHVIMYTYYGLAALGEKYKKYLVWKKYMTYLQLAQFVGIILYAISLWYNQCDISKAFIAMNFIHAALFLGLFLNFFIQNYTRKPTPKKSPVLVGEDVPKMCSEVNPKVTANGEKAPGTHVKHLVSLLKREAGTHLAQIQSFTTESCCHMNCGVSQCVKRNGNQHNYCIPESMNSYPKFNSLSLPESLKHRKLFKGL